MNDKDKKDLDKLYKISRDIRIIYQRLIHLEISDNKISGKYLKLMTYLNEMIYLEDKIYGSSDFNISKFKNIVEYMKREILSDKNMDNVLIDNNTDLAEYYRIYYNIYYIIANKLKNLEDLSMFDVRVKKISFGNTSPIKEIDELILMIIRLTNCFSDDYYSSFLMFLEDEIKNESNKNIRDELIYRKYYVLYFAKNVEKLMANYNFECPKQIYSNSKLFTSINNIPEGIFISGNDGYFASKMKFLFEYYLKLDLNKKTERIITECMIKSMIANTSKEIMNVCAEKAKEELNMIINIPKLGYNARKLIEILNNKEEYQNRVNIVAFGKIK